MSNRTPIMNSGFFILTKSESKPSDKTNRVPNQTELMTPWRGVQNQKLVVRTVFWLSSFEGVKLTQ